MYYLNVIYEYDWSLTSLNVNTKSRSVKNVHFLFTAGMPIHDLQWNILVFQKKVGNARVFENNNFGNTQETGLNKTYHSLDYI